MSRSQTPDPEKAIPRLWQVPKSDPALQELEILQPSRPLLGQQCLSPTLADEELISLSLLEVPLQLFEEQLGRMGAWKENAVSCCQGRLDCCAAITGEKAAEPCWSWGAICGCFMLPSLHPVPHFALLIIYLSKAIFCYSIFANGQDESLKQVAFLVTRVFSDGASAFPREQVVAFCLNSASHIL